MLVLYGYAINFDLRHVPLGIQDDDRTPESRRLIDAFSRGESFAIAAIPDSPAAVTRALDAGEVRAVLAIPRGYAGELAAGRTATVQLLVDGADSTSATTAIGYAGAVVREHSGAVTLAALRRRGLTARDGFPPLEARVRFWYNPEQRSVNYIVARADRGDPDDALDAPDRAHRRARARARHHRAARRLAAARPELILGKLAPYAAIAFLDVLLVMGAGRVLFGVRIAGSIPLLLALAVLYLVAALGIGLLISVAAPTQQTAMTAGMLASQLPTVLLSGFIFPIRAMPEAVQWLTNAIPARHFLVIVRGIFLKASPLAHLWPQVLALAAIAALTLTLAARKFRKKI